MDALTATLLAALVAGATVAVRNALGRHAALGRYAAPVRHLAGSDACGSVA